MRLWPKLARGGASNHHRGCCDRSTPALAPLVARQFTGSITRGKPAAADARRVRGGPAYSTSPRSFRHVPSSRHSTAHQVNVEGTLTLLEFAQHEGESHGRPVTFIYPSSIAAYGLPERRHEEAGGSELLKTHRPPDHDVQVQQMLCEELNGAARRATNSTSCCTRTSVVANASSATGPARLRVCVGKPVGGNRRRVDEGDRPNQCDSPQCCANSSSVRVPSTFHLVRRGRVNSAPCRKERGEVDMRSTSNSARASAAQAFLGNRPVNCRATSGAGAR